MQPYCLIPILIIYILTGVTSAGSSLQSKPPPKPKPRTVGPCQACRIIITSFQHGIDRTSAAALKTAKVTSTPSPSPQDPNSTVNNTRPKNPSQAQPLQITKEPLSSSMRFEEIMKSLCSEVKVGREQCAELAIKHSNLLQEWWLGQSPSHPPNADPDAPVLTGDDLLTWLCIDRLKVCCPYNHYGPECTRCEGHPNICSGHGKCKGNGTRKGNGLCNCDTGYIGPQCHDCVKMYYEAYKDDTKIICSPCHRACLGSCTGPGTKHCESCNEGWETDDEKGCVDVNECLMIEKACRKDEFCVNTEGSYTCFDCDRSCDGCYGDGPDMCEKCAKGYSLIDKLCIDFSQTSRDKKVDFARYLTYFGLCVSTCIIFQKNMAIASVIGVAVGMYIATSEYLLNEQP